VAAGFTLADPIVGLGITVAILFILKGAAQDVFHRLLDAVDPELVGQVEQVLTKVDGVQAVNDIHLRWIGHRLRAEVEVTVDSTLSVIEGHQIAVMAHHALLHGVPRLASALVHANPSVVEGQDHHAELAHHYPN
jgi:divalent metal cation (Fe/Co/Zn/Cd) transporter